MANIANDGSQGQAEERVDNQPNWIQIYDEEARHGGKVEC